MSRLDELKQGIVDIVKKEYRLQMVNMFEGNVSVRYEDKMLITPSQINKEIMTPEMIIETDMEGNILYQPENLHPSSENKDASGGVSRQIGCSSSRSQSQHLCDGLCHQRHAYRFRCTDRNERYLWSGSGRALWNTGNGQDL